MDKRQMSKSCRCSVACQGYENCLLSLQQTFHYDSDFWKNKNDFNLPGGETGFDSQEPTYWETPFSKICLGMKQGQHISFIAIDKQSDSLYSLIADDQHRATSLGREKWKSLIGQEASLQPNCNIYFIPVFNFFGFVACFAWKPFWISELWRSVTLKYERVCRKLFICMDLWKRC